MGEKPHAMRQFIEVIDAGIDLAPLQGADVGSFQSAAQAQFLLGPSKQRTAGTQIRRKANARCSFSELFYIGHGASMRPYRCSGVLGKRYRLEPLVCTPREHV